MNSNIKVTNCTIYGSYSGVICSEDTTLTITNCIVLSDISNPSPIVDLYGGSVISVTYSDIRSGWPGEGNIDADPMFVDANSGDYRLRYGSPCINAGTNNPPAGLPETDLDGRVRIKNGIVDINEN